jgi:hypothetical protein
MSTVFISYRRETTAGEARALFNSLASQLGQRAVFMDVDSISLGRDFRRELQRTLSSCDIMLVLIDKDWATLKDEKGRARLENADDYVRMEVESGLRRDIVVTPVLVRGGRMPLAEELPAEIRDLAYRECSELSHNRWASDVQEMIRRLGLTQAVTPLPRRPIPMILCVLAVLAYLVLGILQSLGVVGTATGLSATTPGAILTAVIVSLGIIGVLLNFLATSLNDPLMLSVLAVLAYLFLAILQSLGVVGTATGLFATTSGAILTAVIASLGIIGVLLKFLGTIRTPPQS